LNNIKEIIKIETILKKNKLLEKIGILSRKEECVTRLKNISKNLNSSNITLQLYREDEKYKDYIFTIIEKLEKNGIQIDIIEFDKIFSSNDMEKINKNAKINFRYVYPNYIAGTNISTEMKISDYMETLKKVQYLTKVAKANFSKKEEQVIFIANQISNYVNYDFEFNKKTKEEYLEMSSLQGCLEGKKTICSGIAFAFERCMTELGIENMLIMGYVGKREKPSILDINHVWNKVKIDDNWYNVDVTNILNVPNSKIPKEKRMEIFILSSDESLKKVEQTPSDSEKIPKSNSDFKGKLEIYHKINKAQNVLKQYDKGNTNILLKYDLEDNEDNYVRNSQQKEEKINVSTDREIDEN